MSTRLSVNVNKIATLRNARGGNNPDIISLVKKIEDFGLTVSLFIRARRKAHYSK